MEIWRLRRMDIEKVGLKGNLNRNKKILIIYIL
jgi:hypothetical protein